MYKLFKKLYKKRILNDIKEALEGYDDFITGENKGGYKCSMSWESFKDNF